MSSGILFVVSPMTSNFLEITVLSLFLSFLVKAKGLPVVLYLLDNSIDVLFIKGQGTPLLM